MYVLGGGQRQQFFRTAAVRQQLSFQFATALYDLLIVQLLTPGRGLTDKDFVSCGGYPSGRRWLCYLDYLDCRDC